MDPAPQFMPKFAGSGRLAGKVAVISGGDSGIGRACSVLFAREGAKVAIIYLEEDEDAEETADLVEAEGSEALLLRGDVGDKRFCEEAIAEVIAHFGKIDVLVNNAAEQHPQDDLTQISEEQLERTFRTNVFGYFFWRRRRCRISTRGPRSTRRRSPHRGSPT